MFARTIKIFTETSTSSNHLVELGLTVDRFEEDEVHNTGYINARIEHIYRDGDLGLYILFLSKLIERALGFLVVRVDHPTEVGEVGIKITKDLLDMKGMTVVSRKDDGLA